MELQNLLHSVRELLADGQLENAVKLVDSYVFEKHAQSDELIGDVIQLRRQSADINQAKIRNTLSNYEIRVQESKLTDAITIFLSKLRDYETNLAVRAEISGRGLLMHNIPRKMPMGLPTRCTIRIGAIVEELMQDMEKEEFAKVEAIKVAKVMEVQLLSDQPGAFDIKTVNRPEQEVDFDTFAQWRYDVMPMREGQFSLTLKVATVKYVDGKDRYAEDVYDITVLVETMQQHLSHTQTAEKNWEGVAMVDASSKEKSPIIPVVPIRPVIKPDIYPELDDNYEEDKEEPPYHPPIIPPYLVDVPSKQGSGKLLAILATVVVLAGVVWAIWYFNKPNQVLTDATFAIDPQMRIFNVNLNGSPIKEWSYAADSSAIILTNLTVGETYGVEAQGVSGTCSDTLTIYNQQKEPYLLHCWKGTTTTGQFGLTIIAPYPLETLLLNGQQVAEAVGQQEVKLSVAGGVHTIEAPGCNPVKIEVKSDEVIKLDCKVDDMKQSTFNVQLQVHISVYNASQGNVRLEMDGLPVSANPSFEVDFVVFNLLDVPAGQHSFVLSGVKEAFVCQKLDQYIGGDMTLTFECGKATYNVTFIISDIMAKYAGEKLDMAVDGNSVPAYRQGSSSSYVMTGISHGSHIFKINPPPCWVCPEKIVLTVTSTQKEFKLDCSCVN